MTHAEQEAKMGRLTTSLCATPAWPPSTKPYYPSVIGIPRMVGKETTMD